MEGKLIKKENHYYFWSSDWNPDENKGFVANSEGTTKRKLSLKNCEAIANGYDLDELGSQKYLIENTGAMFMPNPHEVNNIYRQEGFKEGFQKALEILGDKKFSEEDMINFAEYCKGDLMKTKDLFNEYQSLQQTEWDVVILMGTNYRHISCVDVGEHVSSKIVKDNEAPMLDKDGCLILRRI